MTLILKRQLYLNNCTMGELLYQNKHLCWTLEDKVRPIKIAGETAIPVGEYKIKITFSNRFQKNLPLLLDVPNFIGVRIHGGNDASDTEGCILVGRAMNKNGRISNCKPALKLVMDLISKSEIDMIRIVP